MAKKSFETSLKRLEQITAELEAGELDLEKSLDRFNEGITLVRFCSSTLEEAKSRIDLLLHQEGQLQTTPFTEIRRGNQDLPE